MQNMTFSILKPIRSTLNAFPVCCMHVELNEDCHDRKASLNVLETANGFFIAHLLDLITSKAYRTYNSHFKNSKVTIWYHKHVEY